MRDDRIHQRQKRGPRTRRNYRGLRVGWGTDPLKGGRRENGCDLAAVGRTKTCGARVCRQVARRSATRRGPGPPTLHRRHRRRAGRKRVFKKLNSDHSWHSDPRCRNRSTRTHAHTRAPARTLERTHTRAHVLYTYHDEERARTRICIHIYMLASAILWRSPVAEHHNRIRPRTGKSSFLVGLS